MNKVEQVAESISEYLESKEYSYDFGNDRHIPMSNNENYVDIKYELGHNYLPSKLEIVVKNIHTNDILFMMYSMSIRDHLKDFKWFRDKVDTTNISSLYMIGNNIKVPIKLNEVLDYFKEHSGL